MSKFIKTSLKKRAVKWPVFGLLGAFLIFGTIFAVNYVFAVGDATIAPASNGTNVSIDTTSAPGGSGTWRTLSGPTINETAPGSIEVGTHTFNLPDGWEFNTGSTVTVVRTVGDIEPESQVITPGPNSFTFSITGASTANSGLAFIISSMKVRPTGIAPSTGNITHSSVDGAAIAGVTDGVGGTSFGTLSTIAGAPTQVKIETAANGSGTVISPQDVISGNTLTAYTIERDQFNNFVNNVAATWSLIDKTPDVVDANLVPAGDSKSATFTGVLVGSGVIHAVDGSFTDDTGTLTVVPGPVSADNSIVAVDKDRETVSGGDNIITITVTVKDAAGNVIPNSSVTVDSTGTENELNPVPATTNALGVATVTFSSTKAEEKTITATADGTLIVLTQEVTFNHDVASRLEMATQPSATATAGEAFATQPVVKIVDQFGNLISEDDLSVITATRNSASGSRDLGGTLTATVSGGIATFTNIVYTEAVTIALNFSSDSLTPVTSNSIAVAPNVPSVVTFSTAPAAVITDTVDNPISTQPIVLVKDAYENNVANGTDVLLTKASGAGDLRGALSLATTNGLATFTNVAYSQVDIFKITATAGTVSATSGDIGPLKAGVITAFTLTAPTPVTAGTAFTVSVAGAVDQFGNPASGTVTVSASSGGGDSPSGAHPEYNPITVTDGTGSAESTLFNAVSTVLHGAAGLAADDTAAITVNSDVANKVVVTSSKASVNADGVDSAGITGQLKDQYDNNRPQAGVSITLTRTKGTLDPAGMQTTDADGIVVATLTSGADRTAGTATLSATSAGLIIIDASVDFIDVTPPEAPVITNPAAATVVINETTKPTQVISGTAEADSIVEIYIGIVPSGVTTTATGGNFSFSNLQLETAGIVSELDYDAAKVVTVTSTDAADLESAPSNSVSYTQDTTRPTFAIQYYSDAGLTTELTDNKRLKVGTYYIKITANEALSEAPRISIDAEGTANDVSSVDATLVAGNDYKYDRVIASDVAAVGEVLENIAITGTDAVGNTATNINPTNEATKAAYTDTVAPTITSYTLNGSGANVTFDPTNPASVSIVINASEIIDNWVSLQVVQGGVTKKSYIPATDDGTAILNEAWDGSLSAGGTAPDGVYTMEVHMIDRAGNEVDNVALDTYTMTVDTGTPTITGFTAPALDTVYKDNIAVAFTPNDPGPGTALICSYTVDSPVLEGTIPCTTGVPISTTISGASDGRHTLTVTVTDAAGNTVSETSASFVLDTDDTLTVDDTALNNPDFDTIQEAVTKSTAGDTIDIAAGTYDQGASEITINKSLTIAGPNVSISPNGGSRVAEAIIEGSAGGGPATFNITSGTAVVTFEGLTFATTGAEMRSDASGATISLRKNIFSGAMTDGLYFEDPILTLDDNLFTSIDTPNADTVQVGGHYSASANTITITNNTWTGITSSGALNLSSVTGNITGNTFNGVQYYGMLIANTSGNLNISNNTFNNITNPDPGTSATWGAGIRTYHDLGLVYAGPITVTGNTFSNSYLGISVRAGSDISGAEFSVSNNSFTGNTTGILNAGTGTLNAAQNWWGDPSGPYNLTSNPHGTGNAVSDNVAFTPWYFDAERTDISLVLPTATLSGTPADPTSLTSASITVGDANIVYYKYKLDGGAFGAETAVADLITLAGLSDGSHTVYVIGRDKYGNWQAELSATTHTWTVDTAAPAGYAVTLYPSSLKTSANFNFTGAEVGANFTYSLDDTDPMTAAVEGSGIATSTTYHVGSINTSTLSDGVVTLTVVMTDAAGNSGLPATATRTKDTTPPSITINNGVEAGPVKDDVINITSSDPHLSATYNNYSFSSDAVCNSTDFSAPLNTYVSGADFTISGDHTDYLCVRARDSYSNFTYQLVGQLNTDNTNPVMSLSSMFTGQTLTGGNIYTINWTATDLNIGPPAGTPIKIEFTSDGGLTWSSVVGATENDGAYSWTVPAINSSDCQIRVTVTDLATNADFDLSSTFTITHSTVVDTTDPVIAVNSPNGGETWDEGSTHTLTWTATDNVTSSANILVTLDYSTDGSATWHNIVTNTSNSGGHPWTIPAGANSTNVFIRATATDAAGNTGSDMSNTAFNIAVPVAYPDPICTGPVAGVYTCTISLSSGWNLMSLPVIPGSTAIEDVIAGIKTNLDTVQYYYNGDWQTFTVQEGHPELPGVGDLGIMKDGNGYWVNMNGSDTLTIAGTIAPEAPNPPTSYPVISGWNLIGLKSISAYKTTTTYLSTLPSGYIVFDQSNADKTGSYMQGGKGYWLWSTGAGNIVPTD
ncbi:MAG: Ig-like domain-containing protein [Patescibacteria group bacterium]|jgi:hypothetical protein